MEWLQKLLPAFGFTLAPDRPGTQRDYEALAGVIHEGEGRHNALVSYAAKVWVEGMAAGDARRLAAGRQQAAVLAAAAGSRAHGHRHALHREARAAGRSTIP